MNEGKALNVPDKAIMEKINRLSRRKLDESEVYVFNVTLCDNEIDRDFEVFSEKSLEQLGKLFIGKTGIFDHSMRSGDQTARIYETHIEKTPDRLTSYGVPYAALKAGAYMVRTKKNEDLIKEIDAGIKKEVSVGCSVSKSVCSICGKDTMQTGCEHIKGKRYGSSICYSTLENPTDAYEWSFVAVPAQREAGVTKAYNTKKEEKKLENIKDFFKSQTDSVTVTKAQAQSIADYIDSLEVLCEDAKEYRRSLIKQAKSLAPSALPEVSAEAFEAVCKHLKTSQLRQLCDGFLKVQQRGIEPIVQLASTRENQTSSYNEYKI